MDALIMNSCDESLETQFVELDFVYGCKILLVDDQPLTTEMLEAMFEPLGFYTLAVNNSMKVTEALLDFEPDLILLDVDMPGKNGFEISQQLKASRHFRHIPIILLTAMDDKEAVVKGLSFGVQDYVTKPFHKAELTARVINNLRLKKQHDFWRLNQKLINEQFDHKGVPLKSTFYQYLEKTVAQNNGPLALAVFNIFALDDLIASLSCKDAESLITTTIFERLHNDTSVNAFSGSLGSGKFGIIFLTVPDTLEYYLETLRQELEKPILISGSKKKLKVNMGFCQSRCNVEDWSEILEKAEQALSEAQKIDTPALHEYCPKNQDAFNEKWWIYNQLEEAISNDGLDVHYQPQFSLKTMQCTGYEALARWKPDGESYIPPDKFIPIAERYGLIESLSLRIFDQSLQELRALPCAKIALNLSPIQLKDSSLPMVLLELLQRKQIEIEQVELELTESTMMDNRLISVVEHLIQLGFKVAIDDFGTGYSNLSLLTRLSFAKVKIDRSLINEIHTCHKAEALVSSVVSFSEKVGFSVLAEGVETEAQANKLQSIGVDEVQGYYFGKPEKLADIQKKFRQKFT